MFARPVAACALAALLCITAGCSSDKNGDPATPTSPAPTSPTATTSPASSSLAPTDSGAVVTPTTADAGTGAPVQAVALPEDWPPELALPSGVAPTRVSDQPKQKLVVANTTGDLQIVYDTLKKQLTDAGYHIVGSTFTATDTGGYGSISALGATYSAAIAFGPDPIAHSNQVSISVAPVGS